MSYVLLVVDAKVWQRDVEKIPRKDFERVIARIRVLKNDPWPENVDVKKLQHYSIADYRLRVGDYRVLFNRNDERKEIRLLRMLNRSKRY